MNEGSQQLSRVYLLQPKFHVEGYLRFSSYDFLFHWFPRNSGYHGNDSVYPFRFRLCQLSQILDLSFPYQLLGFEPLNLNL